MTKQILTERRQQQAICDRLNGQPPQLNIEQLKDPYDYLYGIVEASQSPFEAQQNLYHAKSQYPDLTGIIEDILRMEPGYNPTHQTLAEIGPGLPDVNWLWENWIPRGYLTMLAAWPGIGKTYLGLDIARRIIGKMAAPDNSPLNLTTGKVIYVDAEDFLPMVNLRAHVWGMDGSKFYPLRRAPRDLIDMTKQNYQDQLIDMCYDLRPDLVIVDSLSSVSSKGENSIEDLRDILTYFVELPTAFDTALVLIHHLRKPGKGNNNGGPISMHDLRGSGHLVAMARSIIGLDTIDADSPNAPRLLKIIKTNLCMYPDPLSVKFTPSENPQVANLVYGKGDLIHLPETTTGECANWLITMLEEGPKSFNELLDMAGDEYSKSTLHRARQMLNGRVVDTLGGHQEGNKWAILHDIE